MRFATAFSLFVASCAGVLADPLLTSFPNSLTLSSSFDPIKAAYWTGLPHHRRTPFAVSPDGKSAYIAYLDATYAKVVVQQVDTTTFSAVGTSYSTAGYEAAGLVAHNDGFALLANVKATGTASLPPTGQYITVIIRVKAGVEAYRTALNGPGVHPADMLTATTDANGDLVYSEASGLYAAYFVVTAYTTDYSGHFGDSIQYVTEATGALKTISGASSVFGCSHNTGIGLEAADAAPFASVCAEDQGAIWLNTNTQYMAGVKIANENTTNGVSGEPMGGMSGSYSNLALFPGTTNYVFAWQSRGALALTQNTWLGGDYTQCSPRWLNHNVAISTMASKDKLTGAEASSTVGAKEGDTQVNWITYSDTDDHQNVHVATLNSKLSVVSWETLTSPKCEPVPLSCSGTYAGTSFQFVDNTGAKVGSVTTSKSVFVSGDFANVGTDKVCWPYVDMTWDLSSPKDSATPVTKMSFACASSGSSSAVASSSPAAVASSTSAVVKVAESSIVVPVIVSSAPVVVTPTSEAAPIQTTFAESVTIATTLTAIESPVATSTAEAVVESSEAIQTTFAASVTIATTLTAIESPSAAISSFSIEPFTSAAPVVSAEEPSATPSAAPVSVVVQTSIVTVVPIEATPVPTAAISSLATAAGEFSSDIPAPSSSVLVPLPTDFPSGTYTGTWGPRGTGFFKHSKSKKTRKHGRTTTATPTATAAAVAKAEDVDVDGESATCDEA